MPKKKQSEDLPIWKQPPRIGERWRMKNANGQQETRTVVERTLGGHVGFVVGRWTRFAHQEFCTLENWKSWRARAKRVTP